jgi:hypothetical protein
MAAYNFKKQFAPAVKSGKKRCTMRQRRKNGYLPEPGEMIDLYTGMRSKGCEKLRRVKVKAVTAITILLDDEHTRVAIEGFPLGPGEILDLAQRDGFSSVAEFRGFFRSQYGTEAHLYLIEW